MIPNSDHNQNLAPDDTLSGVLLNHEWRQLVVPILYEGLFRYINDITDETEQQTFIARVDALIDDIYTESPTMAASFYTVARNTTQSILTAGSNLIEWNTGTDYDAGNPTRLTVPSGLITLSTFLHFTSTVAFTPSIDIYRNGALIARESRPSATAHFETLTIIDSLASGAFYEIGIEATVNVTLQTSVLLPNLRIIVIE